MHQYTLLFDLSTPSTGYQSLLNLDPGTNDYEIGIHNNTIGSNSALGGYSSTVLSTNQWNRLVLVINTDAANTSADPAVLAYLNGNLVKSWSGLTGTQLANLRLSSAAGGKAYFFADNNRENAALDVASLGLWGRALSAMEVAALGKVGDNGILANAFLNGSTSKVEYTAGSVVNAGDAALLSVALPSQITVNAGGSFSLVTSDSSPRVLSGLPDLRSLVTDKGWTFNRAGVAPELWTSNLEMGTNVNRADNFTGTASGWLSVKTTGSYYFWMAADDQVLLRIRDDSGAVIAVARDPSPNPYSQWDGTGTNGVLNTGAVFLEADKYYRFEAVLTEVGGTDWFRIGVTSANGTGTYVANVVGSSENYPPLMSWQQRL